MESTRLAARWLRGVVVVGLCEHSDETSSQVVQGISLSIYTPEV